TYVFIDRWGEIGRDTLLYYTFTQKGVAELIEFWVLFLIVGFLHESAHGLTCKHYGAGVHRMGFLLIYLSPAFYVDTVESYIYSTRWQRLAITIAGIWVELMCCAVATFVWWGTAPGSGAHEWAYKIMLITGVAVVVMNMNPLIKLDGYYVVTDLFGIGDLKEDATAFLSTWVKRNVFGLPVEVHHVPRRRQKYYVFYALLSGLYSYALLLFAVVFLYHILRNYSPDWAFVPAIAVGLLI